MTSKTPKKPRAEREIMRAFIALMEKTNYLSITIQNILDESEYSRGTFYAHFSDKEDLVKKLIQSEVDVYMACTTHYLAEIQTEKRTSDMRTQVKSEIEAYMRHVYDNQNLYRLIYEQKIPDFTFSVLAMRTYKESIRVFQVWTKEDHSINLDMFAYLTTNIHMCAVQYWINHDFAQSPSYIAEQISFVASTSKPIWIKGAVSP